MVNVRLAPGNRLQVDLAGPPYWHPPRSAPIFEAVPSAGGWVIVSYTGATLFVPHPDGS